MKNILTTILVIFVFVTIVSARPAEINRRQKRQSDQRIAELETLLALQKYGHNRLSDWGKVKENGSPGFGLIDFDKIGRRKKSTRFSPGVETAENNAWNSWMEENLDDSRHSISSSSINSLESQLDQK